MHNTFRGRDFLALTAFSREEMTTIIDTAEELKHKWLAREPHRLLEGHSIAVLFEKKSTRTRISFQAGLASLGADSFYLRPDELQLSRGEPIKDTARVIDRYCDALVIRTFGQEIVDEYAQYMDSPVINALTDLEHPCQVLCDLLTIREKKGRLTDLKVAYAGDLWNVCHSLMIACATFGIDLYIARPLGYEVDKLIHERAIELAEQSGSDLVLTANMAEACNDADVIYGNTWHSMGVTEAQAAKRVIDWKPFQVNEAALQDAKPDVIFMHCLPGYRGEDMTEEVIEGPHSVVWDQAENRMHAEKAVLALFVP